MTIRALVVGGTSGIGYAMANRLAMSLGPASTVVISGRTKPAEMPHPNVEFRPLDASSMRTIKKYTDTFKASQPQLDYLIMSQGIMTTAGRTETAEGIDRKMAIHFYGKQLLLRELLPVLTDSARVIIVLDAWLGSPSKLIWDDLDLKTHYSLGKAADHCVSMTDAMVQYWARQQKRAAEPGKTRHFVHAYPGGVNTNLLRDVVPRPLHGTVRVLGNVFLTSPDQCAERLLRGAEECAAEGGAKGRFWSNIDNKGRLFKNKAEAPWSDDQIDTVAAHTWKIVDAGLAVPE
ncbi:hypothetical protein QBC47DRAFT_121519 [Echria macrotheca]|uniref:Uncharacterized protein n=1 Tax=Echria macrotheca TaxID=438768 RepID=A0AAJ0B2H9_9PEZI|nr:hypothetical protein QBC47DRAFT_121519 [Echria macrotheca]